MAPTRLTMVLTHPVQYLSPWFRHISAHRPELDLTVLYGAVLAPAEQGTGFGTAFAWDVPLLDGYRYHVCSDGAGKRFDSDHLLGIDVPDIGSRIAETNPDAVLVPGWHSLMLLRAVRASRKQKVPVLYRGDSTLFSGPRRFIRPFWAMRTRLMLRQFDGYLAVGTRATEYLRAFGIPDERIALSPHCVDNERFSDAVRHLSDAGGRADLRRTLGVGPGDFVVLFAGKFQPRKRPLDAVRAVAGLGPGAVLVMAGDGPLAGAAKAEAARLGVRLVWRGFVNQSELPPLLAACDCVVVPSTWETWGLIVNEALAVGRPCVVTGQVPAGTDLIEDGVTGYVVPVGDVDTTTRRLADIRRALDRRHAFAPACRARVATHNFDTATDGLVAGCRTASRVH